MVLACEEPDAERSEGVIDEAAEPFRVALLADPGAGVMARPTVELVRGRLTNMLTR
jgi:hypothetical protein